jgi:hypothetical protein
MSLSFPSSPSPGDSFITQGITFVWTGTVWAVPPNGLTFATEAEARGGVAPNRAMTSLRGAQAIDEFDLPPGSVAPPEAICIAMCIFNGSSGAILFERNISAISGAGTGAYGLTFRNPPLANDYCVLGSAVGVTNHPLIGVAQHHGNSTNLVAAIVVGTTGGNLTSQQGFLVASPLIHVGIFR